MNIGLAGAVRCVVTNADGSVKTDTGFIKNLILNQGLDFFGGGNGANIFYRCLVGTGNSMPTPTQNKLDLPVKMASGTSFAVKYDFEPREDNLYVVERTYKYIFSTMGDVNISEVGLASNGTTTANAYMCTRALIKDAAGNPTAISVKNTEKLEVYYKITTVFSTLDMIHQIQYTDAANVTSTYNATVRMSELGGVPYNFTGKEVGQTPLNYLDVWTEYYFGATYRGELGSVDGGPNNDASDASDWYLEDYIQGSYKRLGGYSYALSKGNGNIRSMQIFSNMGVWQVRYGSVLDDSPISKTNKDTMVLPFEITWGRFEGTL
nr:hypothetical protein [uncultured Psychrobacter sp.]